MRRLLLALVPWLVATAAAAQPADVSTMPPPAHVARAEGTTFITREGSEELLAAGTILATGDRVETRLGRIDIRWEDGTSLALDNDSSVEVIDDHFVRLTSGHAVIATGRGIPSNDEGLRVDTPAASVLLFGDGEFWIDLVSPAPVPDTQVSVARGYAELVAGSQSMPLRAGERLVARSDGAVGYPTAFNVAAMSAIAQWARAQLPYARESASAGYLPQDLSIYGSTLDQYGTWESDVVYGYVWYPRVAYGWRPYFQGHWKHDRRYGWTWIGLDTWAWPTHHYGRWGYGAGGRWFWVPRSGWGPGWVSWAIASDYIGWCPIDSYGRPALSFTGSFDARRPYAAAWNDPGRAWTVIPRGRFGERGPVGPHAVSTSQFAANGWPAFVVQSEAPGDPRPRVAPRGLSTAVPRQGVPPTRVDRGDEDRFERWRSYGTPGGPAARPRTEDSPYERANRVMQARAPRAPRAPENAEAARSAPPPRQAPADEETVARPRPLHREGGDGNRGGSGEDRATARRPPRAEGGESKAKAGGKQQAAPAAPAGSVPAGRAGGGGHGSRGSGGARVAPPATPR